MPELMSKIRHCYILELLHVSCGGCKNMSVKFWRADHWATITHISYGSAISTAVFNKHCSEDTTVTVETGINKKFQWMQIVLTLKFRMIIYQRSNFYVTQRNRPHFFRTWTQYLFVAPMNWVISYFETYRLL